MAKSPVPLDGRTLPGQRGRGFVDLCAELAGLDHARLIQGDIAALGGIDGLQRVGAQGIENGQALLDVLHRTLGCVVARRDQLEVRPDLLAPHDEGTQAHIGAGTAIAEARESGCDAAGHAVVGGRLTGHVGLAGTGDHCASTSS